MQTSAYGFILVFGVVMIAQSGCDDPIGPGATPVPDVREWVVGEAAKALDEHGHFILGAAIPPGDMPVVSGARARDLALAYIRTTVTNPNVVGGLESWFEMTHGADIDWSRLTAGERVFYGRTPHAAVPATEIGSIIRAYGPQFLVPLEVDGVQVAVVTVAAYTTEVTIDSAGFIHRPGPHNGNEFVGLGVPYRLDYRMPLTPERAVATVGGATGTRIVDVPVLVLRRAGDGSVKAMWRLRLTSEVRFTLLETGESILSDTVFVGLDDPGASVLEWSPAPTWFLPATTQPVQDTLTFPVRNGSDDWVWRTIIIGPRPSGIPINLREVTVGDTLG